MRAVLRIPISWFSLCLLGLIQLHGCGSASRSQDGIAILSLAAGNQHTCAVVADGRLYCWGLNESGQLGDGTTGDRMEPTEITAVQNVDHVVAGRDHTCALANGLVYCWGINQGGQLGDGSTQNRHSPVLVEGLSSVVELASHWDHTCARSADGAISCWGANNGRFGNGDIDSSPTPVPAMAGVENASVIAAGWGHTCALLPGGVARCAGTYNQWGQIGDGSDATERLTPVEVIDMDAAVDIKTGSYHTCALLTDQTMMCWGNNQGGQLGNGGTSQERNPPAQVPGLSGVVAIETGGFHTCAVLDGGSLRCWGSGEGIIGDGSDESRLTPTPVAGVTGVNLICAHSNHSCVATANHEVYCWGSNGCGQLGDGTTENRNVPARVTGLPSQ